MAFLAIVQLQIRFGLDNQDSTVRRKRIHASLEESQLNNPQSVEWVINLARFHYHSF